MTFSLHKLVGLPAIAAAAFFMQALDATILNTALPAVARSLDRSPLAMQLAVVGYTLTVAMLIPVSGWLADRFGTRRVFISAVNFFILGSLLCALSTSLPMLVASRVLQGIGGAMMMPVARLAVLRAYPRTELVAVLNFISIPGLVGPVVGPLLGGWLVTYATWHWIFLINIPIGLIGILYAYHIMPDFTAPRRPFDWMGFFLFGLSLVSFSSGLEVFGDRVGPDFLPPVLLISGIALLGLYIRHARRHPSPLIRLSVFRTRTFSVGIGGNILSRLGTGCVPFLMPLMLQVGLGYPALVAGAMMAPTAIGSITAKTFAMKILNRFGYRVTLTGVTVCIGLMIAQFALQTPTLPLWMLILPLFMLGMAMSTQFTAMNSITLGDLSTEDASTGNGLLSVTQQLSISFGVASSTVVLRFYNSFASGTLLDHFHYTFITIGGITMMAAFVFMLLRKDDGDSLLPGRKKPVFETTSSPTLPLWMLILPLFMLGMAMSTQFTAMNSITLGDLSTEDASTGNGLLSVTQQLSISFGVASSTVVLRFYNSFASGTLLDHFHYTFITIGGITMMAAFVFMLLRKDDGDSLLPGRKKPVFETTSSPTPRNP